MVEKLAYQREDGKTSYVTVDEYPLCPWCFKDSSLVPKHVHFEEHWVSEAEGLFGGTTLNALISCHHCNRLFLADYFLRPDNMEGDPFEFYSTLPPQPNMALFSLSARKDLPVDLQSDLREAAECLRYGLFQAFAAMARRALHSICADKHTVGKDLKTQIDFLKSNQTFNSEIADRAHEIRTFGNQGAHPEFEPITEELAYEGSQHLSWIVGQIYQPTAPRDNQRRNNTPKRYTVPKK